MCSSKSPAKKDKKKKKKQKKNGQYSTMYNIFTPWHVPDSIKTFAFALFVITTKYFIKLASSRDVNTPSCSSPNSLLRCVIPLIIINLALSLLIVCNVPIIIHCTIYTCFQIINYPIEYMLVSFIFVTLFIHHNCRSMPHLSSM